MSNALRLLDEPDLLKGLTNAQTRNLFAKLEAVAALINAPRGQKGGVVATIARARQVSEQAVLNWQTIYNKFGAAGLVDGRRAASKNRSTLPEVTKAWITAEILRMKRNDGVMEVRRLALAQWRVWRRQGDPKHAIPGYLNPPRDCGKGYPAGWSYENFRRCQPENYQKAIARQGRINGDRLLPSILGTRVGTRYLEVVYFDDQQYDHLITAAGHNRPMVPLGFNAIDKLTAYAFQPHIRLRWRDEANEQYKHLTMREFVWYAITRLCAEGYRTDEVGTTYVKEHGTANTWSNQSFRTPLGFHSFEDAAKSLFNGCVRLDDSGLYNKAVFAEMLHGPQSAGNPRFKAPIESFFHLVRTYHLALPGQTGRNIDEAPEENYGLVNYEARMIKLAADLPPNLAQAIRSELYTAQEYAYFAHLAYGALNERDDHNLQGWADCGFVSPKWKWAEDPPEIWRDREELASLPPHLIEHANHQASLNPSLRRSFKMRPADAMRAVCNDPAIRRMRPEDAVLLVPMEWAQPVKIRSKREIHISDPLLSTEELIYFTEITNQHGRTEYLSPGDNVLAYVNPFDLDRLLICDQQGTYIGSVVRSVRVGRDRETLELMFRERARMANNLEGPVRAAMAPLAAQRKDIKANNDEVIATEKAMRDATPQPLTPTRSRGASVDILSADTVPDTTAPEADPFL
jgi:hypothetical protein